MSRGARGIPSTTRTASRHENRISTMPKQPILVREAQRVLDKVLMPEAMTPRIVASLIDLLDGSLADAVEPTLLVYLRTMGWAGIRDLKRINPRCGQALLLSSRPDIVGAMLDILENQPDPAFRPALSTLRKRWNYFGKWTALKKRAAILEKTLLDCRS